MRVIRIIKIGIMMPAIISCFICFIFYTIIDKKYRDYLSVLFSDVHSNRISMDEFYSKYSDYNSGFIKFIKTLLSNDLLTIVLSLAIIMVIIKTFIL